MTFDVDGMDELLKQLDRLQEIGDDMQKAGLKAGGKTLQNVFKDNIYNRIDRDSGTARESITLSRVNKKGKLYVGPTGEAFYLEFLVNGFFNKRAGKFIPATPIFQPLFLQNRMKVVESMIEAAREELSKL